LFDQVWVVFFKHIAHDREKGVWMPELRCAPPVPFKKSLVCAAFRWLDVTLIDGNSVTLYG
jgi:hypothetical protein